VEKRYTSASDDLPVKARSSPRLCLLLKDFNLSAKDPLTEARLFDDSLWQMRISA
jgi:hypothetical protein